MVYGDDKVRTMTRSLLPSRGRRWARQERASLHRAARREARMESARLAGDPEAFEDATAPAAWREIEVNRLVSGRRSADKVNPFIRWATAVTRDVPQASRLSHVRGKVPPGVIGEHALTHLERVEAFENPVEAEHRRQLWARWRAGRTPPFLDRGEEAALLRAVLQAGGHGAFNQWLRARIRAQLRAPWSEEGPRYHLPPGALPRPLLGLHDVLPFLDSLERSWRRPVAPDSRWPQAYPRDWVDAFLRAFKQCRGDVEATLAALDA